MALAMLGLQGFDTNAVSWTHPPDQEVPGLPLPDGGPTGSSDFVPVPGQSYVLTAENGSVFAGDSGGARDMFAVSEAAAEANPASVSWVFTPSDAGDGLFHLDLAVGGTNPRVSITDNADEPLFARLTQDRFTGQNTFFAIQDAGDGTFFVTNPGNTTVPGQDRLFLTGTDAGFAGRVETGPDTRFTITAIGAPDPDTPPPPTGGSDFVPVPGQSYVLTAENGSVFAGDSSGARDMFAVSGAAAGANPTSVSWVFTPSDAGDGLFHLDLAIGGTNPRVSITDNAAEPLFARLTQDRFTGQNTFFAIQDAGDGTFFITNPGNTTVPGQDRLSLTATDAAFVGIGETGPETRFTITATGTPDPDAPSPDDGPTGGSDFVPEPGQAYTITAGSGPLLAGDSGDARDLFAINTGNAPAASVAWVFTPSDAGDGLFHLDLAAGGTNSRVSITTADNDPQFARLTQNRFSGQNTYFAIQDAGDGEFFITNPGNTTAPGQDRLSLGQTNAQFVTVNNSQPQARFTITSVATP